MGELYTKIPRLLTTQPTCADRVCVKYCEATSQIAQKGGFVRN